MPAIADHQGPVYMRLLRGKVPLVLDEYGYRFEIGKAKLLRRRRGRAVHFERADDHAGTGSCRSACKPTGSRPPCCMCRPSSRSMRRRSWREAAKPGPADRRAENHTIVGGLGEAVALCSCATALRRRFRQIGLPDAFLDAGALPTLHERYGLSADAVVTAVKSWL